MAGRIAFHKFDFSDSLLTERALDLLNANQVKSRHNRAFWDWRFLMNPFGVSHGWYALDEEKDRLAGLLMWWPWRFTGPGGEITAYQAINGITAEEYRNMGIFLNLNGCAIGYFNDGDYILYGFPNEKSYPAYRRLEWYTAGKIHLLIAPVSYLKGLRMSIAAESDDIIPVEYLYRGEELRLQRDKNAISTKWTGESLRWRFAEHPRKRYYIYRRPSGDIIFTLRHYRFFSEARIVFTNTLGSGLFRDFRRFLSCYPIAVCSYYGSDTPFLRQIAGFPLTCRHFKKVWLVTDKPVFSSVDTPVAVEFCEMDTT
jgi:hypothetical protein